MRPAAPPCPRVRSVSAGLGSRDVGAGDLVAVFDWLARPTPTLPSRRYATLGHPPSAGPRRASRSTCGRPAPSACAGHSIGGFGSVTTNKLVATLVGELFGLVRPGLPALRLGEEGPADDLLPDHRRRADPPACRARPRRLRAAPRRRGVPPGRPARRPGRRRHGLRPVAAEPTRRRSGPRSRPRRAREILARGIRLAALDTAALARSRAPRPDLVAADAGRRPGRRVPAR